MSYPEPEQSIERGASEELSGAPLTETEIEASRRPPSAPPGDGGSSVVSDDAGMAGGASGSSGGGSSMPGHPDSAG